MLCRGFNPRTRMGCDEEVDEIPNIRNVSIHAPAWGATYDMPAKNLIINGFNPRTRMGCDRILSNELNIIVQIYRICE